MHRSFIVVLLSIAFTLSGCSSESAVPLARASSPNAQLPTGQGPNRVASNSNPDFAVSCVANNSCGNSPPGDSGSGGGGGDTGGNNSGAPGAITHPESCHSAAQCCALYGPSGTATQCSPTPSQICVLPAEQLAISKAVTNAANNTKVVGPGFGGQLSLAQKIQSIQNNAFKSDFYKRHAVEFIGKDVTQFTQADYDAYNIVARLGAANGVNSAAYVASGSGPNALIQVYVVSGSALINSGIGSALNPALANQLIYSIYNAANNQLITAFPVNSIQEAIQAAIRTVAAAANSPAAVAAFDSDSPSLSC